MNSKNELYSNLKPFLNCKDFTVSGESYKVMKNQEFEMLVTTPIPENLEKYYKSEAYISHTDAKKTLLDKVYQKVRNYTLQKKLQLINSFNSEQNTLLDIGAGTGDFLATCLQNNWKVFGVEPNLEARNIAKEKNVFLQEKIDFFTENKFDVITLWHVLEHVENLEEYIYKLKSLLKENGTLVIAVPNFKSYDATYYKEFWAAFDVPRHLWHFSQNSIHKLFSKVSMTVVNTLPMKFDAYYVSLLSEKYKKGKMNVFNSFWIGFLSNLKARQSSEYSSLIYVLKNK
ncbi:class I SAM-dependent methyltransferase [uncultured Polaribacter sp.]|uniref:class I SAM-dependent methyltransferase n=1 Tax=uncultured Polaribacter sp. TaxID=174711 RepID=UPI00262B89D6|nr:class I SAM-dependent methyltransferase [uncultured Polaribacter sp.]